MIVTRGLGQGPGMLVTFGLGLRARDLAIRIVRILLSVDRFRTKVNTEEAI